MSDCKLNLTKIQSLPVIETPGKYAFFVDVTFDDPANYRKAKSLLEIMATSFKILGEYQSKTHMTARRLDSVQEYYFSKKLREVRAMIARVSP